jgi:peptide/nickel transport system ATP-binding protein
MANVDLLTVAGLRLALLDGKEIVKGVTFSIRPGEIVGIVGESGSGKTLAARAILSLQPPAIRRTAGTIQFDGQELTGLSGRALRQLRGARIGMVFQEPMTSLDPSMTIGRQLEEGLVLHTKLSRPERRARILEMLTRVALADPESALGAFPHYFSGGMRQRIMLASAMLLRPALLIADEPTTALDAVVQRDVLELMVDLTREYGTAILVISHDLSMIARYTDRVVVMRQGEIVEDNATRDLVRAPREAYTRNLLAAMPHRGPTRPRPPGPPRVEVNKLIVDYKVRAGLFLNRPGKRAVKGVDLRVGPAEVVALVGESGSGKTTLGRSIAGLLDPSQGEILFDGRTITRGTEGWRRYRPQCQMVFQDPYSSLDPRMTVQNLVREALRATRDLTSAGKSERVRETLREVGLAEDLAGRYPHELSGGQRQRVAIARAIATRPAFLIADEPVSALDVTVRAQILDLFAALQARYGFSCLFISHDLGAVEQIADRVVVMRDGEIVEEGDRDQIFDNPCHPYTRQLLMAVPRLEAFATRASTLDRETSCST